MIHHSQQHQLAGCSQKLIMLLRTTIVGHSVKQGQVPPSADVCFWVLPGDVLENTDIYHFDLMNPGPQKTLPAPPESFTHTVPKTEGCFQPPMAPNQGALSNAQHCTRGPNFYICWMAGSPRHCESNRAGGLARVVV